mmetsp:Transcript_78306/g.172832  ORF Transcript_78306/g.172832 Transcript_78306/m.172832 type:complete len:129 (+) Transcript_78306:142-528(+)
MTGSLAPRAKSKATTLDVVPERRPVVAAHRFSADLRAWGHNRMASIERANALRKERDENALGSFPARPRPSSAPWGPSARAARARAALKTYPIMRVIDTIPTRYLPPPLAKTQPRHMHEMVEGQPVIP